MPSGAEALTCYLLELSGSASPALGAEGPAEWRCSAKGAFAKSTLSILTWIFTALTLGWAKFGECMFSQHT